jgi:hypothetical protein
MRSQSRQFEPRTNPLLQCIVEAVAAVASIFMVIGELIAPTTHTFKKSDHTEPPDARAVELRFA